MRCAVVFALVVARGCALAPAHSDAMRRTLVVAPAAVVAPATERLALLSSPADLAAYSFTALVEARVRNRTASESRRRSRALPRATFDQLVRVKNVSTLSLFIERGERSQVQMDKRAIESPVERVVMKFGGSSIANARDCRVLLKHTRARRQNKRARVVFLERDKKREASSRVACVRVASLFSEIYARSELAIWSASGACV